VLCGVVLFDEVPCGVVLCGECCEVLWWCGVVSRRAVWVRGVGFVGGVVKLRPTHISTWVPIRLRGGSGVESDVDTNLESDIDFDAASLVFRSTWWKPVAG
jgi:hypothetical protein